MSTTAQSGCGRGEK